MRVKNPATVQMIRDINRGEHAAHARARERKRRERDGKHRRRAACGNFRRGRQGGFERGVRG